jgi:hypothetical protein
MSEHADATVSGERVSAKTSASPAPPDEALLLRLSAQKLWAEGRNNPVWFSCSSWIGTWVTEDRVTWRTTDGAWVAQLERAANGRHVWMAFYNHGTCQGRQDAAGFHQPARQSRGRRPRPAVRSLPLPLAG